MKKPFPVLVALLVLAASGCAPKVDIEAERAAIRTLDDQMVAAINAGDLAAWLAFFTDDATMMPPNAPAVVGKEAIREFAAEVIASPDFAVAHKLGKVEVSRSGDLAYLSYAYELTLNDPEGNPVTDRGKDISVLKKQPDGAWKIVIDIWNSNQPLPAAPTP